MPNLALKRKRLLERLRGLDDCVVAFSGGVDSAVVAKAAVVARGDGVVAVTAVSPSLAAGELQQAQEVARQIGIRHHVIRTQEIENPAYVANQSDRCFYCKQELYRVLQTRLQAWNARVILNGANVDDQSDHRPGLRAAADFQVISPLAECGLNKEEVRRLARQWELTVADKPATPCLSSRIAYGIQVTAPRLRRIDGAEQWLRARGLNDTRVRLHGDDLARLEVMPGDLARLCVEPMRGELVAAFEQLGFKFVTVDLAGRRSGSLNVLVPVEQLERSRPPAS